MKLENINPWIAGITLVFSGSVFEYLFEYKNNDWITIPCAILIFIGWGVLFFKINEHTIVNGKKNLFSENKPGFFKQRFAKLFSTLFCGLIIGVNIFGILELGDNRKDDILNRQPTKKTIAEVVGIDERQSRHSTSYYAIFEYTVDGKIIHYPWQEDSEGVFIVSQKYYIQYSTEHPDMFRIIRKAP